MAGPIATDTPDYQRGIFNPQALLATVPANTATVTVGVPTNAETLIVVAADIADGGTIFAQGVSTLYKYAGVRLPTQPHMTTATTWFFDVSAAMDERVQITFTDAPGEIWFVYADAAAHVIGDASTLKNTQGAVYSIPSAPATDSGDHPPNELAVAGGLVSTGVNLIAPAGAGNRYRLFALSIADNGSSSDTYIVETSTGQPLLACAAPGSAVLSYPVTGHPLTVNTTLQAGSTSGTRQVFAMMYYTLENF